MSISFTGLKGERGDPGLDNPRQVVVTTLPEQSSLTLDAVYFVQVGDTNEYNRYITQYDGLNYEWFQVGTTEMSLDDYIRKDSLVFCTEEDMDRITIFDANKYYITYEDRPV